MKASQPKTRQKALDAVRVDVSAELSSDDLRSAARALNDLCDDFYPNTLSGADRITLAEVAVWLNQAAKVVEPRDLKDWDTIQAIREDRETRASNQLVAAHYGVGEATVREASVARRIDRSKRRIVR